ncbi:hypothetical protein ACHFCA_14145 [Delftia tsuruhatensis]
MKTRYKDTARSGLAFHIIECCAAWRRSPNGNSRPPSSSPVTTSYIHDSQ